MGLVLYEMLAGAPPFTGDTPLATVLAHQREPVPPLTTRRYGLSRALAAAVMRALAKAPRDRYPDAAAMRAAITSPALASVARATPTTQRERTLVAPTDTMPALPAARVRPRRWFAALLAGIALLFLAGVVLAALVNGDEDPAQQANQTPSSTPTSTSTSSSTTATTAPTAPPGPAPTAQLGAVLTAGPPEAYGDKGP